MELVNEYLISCLLFTVKDYSREGGGDTLIVSDDTTSRVYSKIYWMGVCEALSKTLPYKSEIFPTLFMTYQKFYSLFETKIAKIDTFFSD